MGQIIQASAPTIWLDATPSGHQCPHLYHPTKFMLDAIFAANLPIYPGVGQAPNVLDCIPGGLITAISSLRFSCR